MGLSLEEAKEVIQKRPNNILLNDACNYEEWVKFHSDVVEHKESNFGYRNLIAMVKFLIGDARKVNTLNAFITTPSTTKKEVEKIKRGHKKIFDGKNPIFDIQFSGNQTEDAKNYLKEIDFENQIQEIFNDHYVNPCNFYVVDLPTEATETKPYVYDISCRDVLAAKYKDKNGKQLDFVAFGDFKSEIRVYDDENYRVFVKVGDIWNVEVDTRHDLGFCPVFQLSKPVSKTNLFKRWCPLSDVLPLMDYIVYYEAALKVYEAYGPFPIITKYESDCEFSMMIGHVQSEDDSEGLREITHDCEGGYLVDDQRFQVFTEDGSPKKCPVCAERNYMGPSSLDIVPQPQGSEDRSLLDSPKIHNVNVEGLEYTKKSVENRLAELQENVVGKVDLPDNKSINESQIEASFEEQREVLNSTKKFIEIIYPQLGGTIFKLRYGNTYLGMEYSLGNDFYLTGANNLMDMYNSLRAQKASESILSLVYLEYIDTKYRKNRAKFVEAKTWFMVDPWPHYSLVELSSINGYFSEEDLKLKFNLSSAINDFNSKNNVVIFGEFLEENERINKIKSKLLDYVNNKQIERIGDGQPSS